MVPLDLREVQDVVARWVVSTFDEATAANAQERGLRLLEEVLELCQTQGMGKDQLHALVEYVYARPVGKAPQEVGGVMVTLAAMVSALGYDLTTCTRLELDRIHTDEVVERCRRRQSEKRDAGMTGPATTPPEEVCPSCGGALVRMGYDLAAEAGGGSGASLVCERCNYSRSD